MPDIVWTDKFRLAVIRRIAATLQSYVGGTTCVESESVYRDVSTIVMVSFDDDRDLDSTTSKIEAALGCTLEEVQEGLYRERLEREHEEWKALPEAERARRIKKLMASLQIPAVCAS
jgi:hypothetical protein